MLYAERRFILDIFKVMKNRQIYVEGGIIGGERGGRGHRRGVYLTLDQNVFHFHAVFLGKIDQNNRLVFPLLRLAPHPQGNPGSVTGNCAEQK